MCLITLLIKSSYELSVKIMRVENYLLDAHISFPTNFLYLSTANLTLYLQRKTLNIP